MDLRLANHWRRKRVEREKTPPPVLDPRSADPDSADWRLGAPARALPSEEFDAAAHDRAAKAYSDMIAKVNAVKSMPDLDDKEKTIMTAMQQIGDTLKTLLDANKATLDALKELRQAQK